MRKTLLLAGAGIAVIGLAAIAFAAPDFACARPGFGAGQGPGGERGAMMLQRFDADGDGRVTQAEMEAFRDDGFARFDTDQDGAMSLAEFEAFWAEFSRERMVDRFQALDDDGDGQITVDETQARIDGLFAWADRDNDGALSPADRPERGGRGWRN